MKRTAKHKNFESVLATKVIYTLNDVKFQIAHLFILNLRSKGAKNKIVNERRE